MRMPQRVLLPIVFFGAMAFGNASASEPPLSSQAIATADMLRNTGMAGNAADGSRAYAIVE